MIINLIFYEIIFVSAAKGEHRWFIEKFQECGVLFCHTWLLKYQVTKKKEQKKLLTDKNIDYRNSLHFDNEIESFDIWIKIVIKNFLSFSSLVKSSECVHESTGQSCYMPSHRFQWNFARLKDLPQNSKGRVVSVLIFFFPVEKDHPPVFPGFNR